MKLLKAEMLSSYCNTDNFLVSMRSHTHPEMVYYVTRSTAESARKAKRYFNKSKKIGPAKSGIVKLSVWPHIKESEDGE